MLFSREDHQKYPPSSWRVEKRGRKWALLREGSDNPIDTFATKREAEQAKLTGMYANLYEKEGRWFAGENIPGWRSAAACGV